MSKNEYPKLTVQEIISVLAESQIAAITEKDLKNASLDFISDLFTRLLIYLDILHEEDHGQLDFAALDQLENPDHHMQLGPSILLVQFLISAFTKTKKRNLLRPIYEDLTDLDEQQKEWEAKMSKLDAEIAEYNEARERELPLVEEVDAKVKDLRQNIQDLNKHQVSRRTSIKKLKEKKVLLCYIEHNVHYIS
ncbi:hypothetical protein Q3G72_026391 [Acer saccharum]|nr:hypothetical protein Q3G72_026391 [Acer saccharum]